MCCRSGSLSQEEKCELIYSITAQPCFAWKPMGISKTLGMRTNLYVWQMFWITTAGITSPNLIKSRTELKVHTTENVLFWIGSCKSKEDFYLVKMTGKALILEQLLLHISLRRQWKTLTNLPRSEPKPEQLKWPSLFFVYTREQPVLIKAGKT